MKTIAMLILLLSFPSLARADFLIKPVGAYNSYSSNGITTSSVRYEVAALYMTDKGWLLGGIFSSDTSSAAGVAQTAYGPSVGWITNKEVGPFIEAHYYVPKTVGTSKLSGYQADLGLKLLLKRSAIVLQMSYRKYLTNVSGTTFSAATIEPAFGLIVSF